jgi:DNA-binding transcriptional regulator YiaG
MIDGTDMQLIRTFLMMTREEFAARVGCSPQLVYAAESGRRGISPSLRRSLRRVINGEEFRGMEKRLADLRQKLEEEA